MKSTSVHNRAVRFAAACGLAALFAGLFAASPAHADDWRFHRYRNDAHFDIVAIHHDEDRLHDLYLRRDSLRGRRDWRGVAELDVQIGGVRFHLDNDRYEVRRDFDRVPFYGDRRFDGDHYLEYHDYGHSSDYSRDYNRDRDRYHDGYRVRDGR